MSDESRERLVEILFGIRMRDTFDPQTYERKWKHAKPHILNEVNAIIAGLAAQNFKILSEEPTFEMVDQACFCATTAEDLYIDNFRDESDNVDCVKAHADFRARWRTAFKAAEPKDSER